MRNVRAFLALERHFFRRFFDNDVVTSDADTQSTVVRFISGLAVPGLMVAFWLIKGYPHNVWAATTIHAFYVLYSFAAIGCVAVAEWEYFFPDRLDFLNLLPLPLAPGTMLAAKAIAVARFIALFAVASNVLGGFLLPLAAGEHILRNYYAHFVAAICAGLASSLAVLAVQSILICITPARWMRIVVPLAQVLMFAALIFSLLLLPTLGNNMAALFHGVRGAAFFPPLWYLGLYESCLHSQAATAEAHRLAHLALLSLPVTFGGAMLSYPLAWVKQRQMALEGTRNRTYQSVFGWTKVSSWLFEGNAPIRGLLSFIGHTLLRLNRYQIHLAAYSGTALAIATICAIRITIHGQIRCAISADGLRLMVPFLSFAVVAGIRSVFLLPADLSARWIFRLWPPTTQTAMAATRIAVLTACFAVLLPSSAVLWLAGQTMREVIFSMAFYVLYSILLVEMFFFIFSSIPFTRPRLPGRTSLPLTLVVFVFLLPASTFGARWFFNWCERRLWSMALFITAVAAVSWAARIAQRSQYHPVTDDPFRDETYEEYVRLDLSDA